ncbi:MAG: insulinase family protein [Runella slithyformis]|nr:MAG: insulinase family protein [Runella slithyformis]TAF78718.1 MAG: insulinase family protein [Runella slithyformis]
MQLNRTIAPDFQTVQSVHFPAATHLLLDNGMPLYVINLGQQPVVRLEIVFEAGTWSETVAGSSFFTLKMLSEGTKSHTSAQISERFDEIGAFIDLSHSADRANLTVYGLTKHLEAILQLAQELLNEATFPENEFDTLKNVSLQNLRVNLEKNSYLATIKFRQLLFGNAHPYGRSQNEADISKLTTQHLRDFYEQSIQNQPFKVFLSGQIAQKETDLVNQYLGKQAINLTPKPAPQHQRTPPTTTSFVAEKPDAVQSSLRLGRPLFTRQHPDFYPFMVCNEVLGGYFGSRLVKNIREEKGLTYGISSGLSLLRRDGFWTVSADVKKESVELVFDEIFQEIAELQRNIVPEDELETVKNYLSGEFAGALNTPFEIADRVRLMALENLPLDFYTQHIASLRAVSAEQIRTMAQKYWQSADLLRVVV